jgi:hypothetical protein
MVKHHDLRMNLWLKRVGVCKWAVQTSRGDGHSPRLPTYNAPMKDKYTMPPLTALRFFLLAVLAGLLIALMAGYDVPRPAMAILIFAQAALRFYANRQDPKLRNSSLLQMLISVVLGVLILSS